MYIFLPNSGCRNLHLDLGMFFLTISQVLGGVLPKSRCRFLHSDLGNTEVVPWDLGKKHIFLPMLGCRNLHVDLGSSLIITVTVYSIMIFPAMYSGSFMLRFRKQKCRSFGSEDPKSIASANPSYNNILFYIVSKYSTKKNISELRSNW